MIFFTLTQRLHCINADIFLIRNYANKSTPLIPTGKCIMWAGSLDPNECSGTNFSIWVQDVWCGYPFRQKGRVWSQNIAQSKQNSLISYTRYIPSTKRHKINNYSIWFFKVTLILHTDLTRPLPPYAKGQLGDKTTWLWETLAHMEGQKVKQLVLHLPDQTFCTLHYTLF